jgi:hypothetical protein
MTSQRFDIWLGMDERTMLVCCVVAVIVVPPLLGSNRTRRAAFAAVYVLAVQGGRATLRGLSAIHRMSASLQSLILAGASELDVKMTRNCVSSSNLSSLSALRFLFSSRSLTAWPSQPHCKPDRSVLNKLRA